MICLGIESTAHTFGAGIATSKGKILANVIDSYRPAVGGIIPPEAAKHHEQVSANVINEALLNAKISMNDVNLISFSQGPGLGPCLRVGAGITKKLSLENRIPVVGVNHCIAHLEVGKLRAKAKNPVLLYVSGANTQVISFEGGKYRIMGETLDIGAGNFLDTFARHIGLGFPGGPKVYELALKGKDFVELPYVVKGMDVSFGGILTNLKQKYDSGKYAKEDLCFSAQETIFAMLLEVAERALAHCNKKELLLGGGVACNKRLQEMSKRMCLDRGAKCFIPENEFLVDNGAMIAWLGILERKSASRMKEIFIKPYWRTDQV